MNAHLDMRTLERFVVDDLGAESALSAAAHLAACSACAEKARATRALIADDLRKHPSRPFVEAVMARPKRRQWLWFGGVQLTAVAALLVVLFFAPTTEDVLTPKGGMMSVIHYQGDTESVLEEGDAIKAGDRMEVRLLGEGRFDVRFLPDGEAPVAIANGAVKGSVWFEMAPPCTPGVLEVKRANDVRRLRVRCAR